MPATRSLPVALALSCHPAPTVAVTAMAAVLAATAGNPPSVVALVLAAVLSGQLSIGWLNDLVDARRDREAGRTDKPLAAGAVERRALVIALAVSSTAVVPLSLLLGWRAGAAHLLGVAFGWAYDLGLKATPLSPLAYAVAFGALPAVATLARSIPALPPWWVVAAGALLGVGAHFGNVLPDVEDDRRAGVAGAPQRLGRRGTGVVAAIALVAAAGLLLGPADRAGGVLVLLGAAVVALSAFVAVVARSERRTRAAFTATMVAAALCVAMLVLSGGLAG